MPEIIGEEIDGELVHPCPKSLCHNTSLVLNNDNMQVMLTDNLLNKAIVQCFDTSEVTDMDQFLKQRTINADLSSWDVSSVTNMNQMFYGTTEFNSDVSGWDVSSVLFMQGMFYTATEFNGDVSSWDVSSVSNMYEMFMRATKFNVDVSDWDVSTVTDMRYMFYYATKFGMELCNWNLSSSLIEDYNIFSGSNCTRIRCFECNYAPTSSPSYAPTSSPSYSPSNTLTSSPTYSPTSSPTYSPTSSPTYSPTFSPTYSPTSSPIYAPTSSPTYSGPYPEVKYLGCFKDEQDRALPVRVGNSRTKTTAQCIVLCRGYNFVARQYTGECWCGNDDNYDKYGASNNCNCEGTNVGGWLNCVYKY